MTEKCKKGASCLDDLEHLFGFNSDEEILVCELARIFQLLQRLQQIESLWGNPRQFCRVCCGVVILNLDLSMGF